MGRRRILNKPLIFCLVCGDRAKGKNFGVIACPACTAFFRFTIVNAKYYECKLSGNCQIHVSLKQRCICRFCRLQKCFRLGMDVELVQNRKISGKILTNERKNQKVENDVEEKIIENNFEKNVNTGNMQIEEHSHEGLLLFGKDWSIGLGEVEKLMRNCRQKKGTDWRECFWECRLEEENRCLEDLLENRAILARLHAWCRKVMPKNNEIANMWTKKMYLGAANLLGISPVIHSDFWLSEQLLCVEFFKKMPNFEELAKEDKLKQFRFSMMPATLFVSAYYSQQEGMQHLVGNKGISPIWAYGIDMYANDANVANMSNEIYVDFVSKLAHIQLTTNEFIFLLAMVFYQAACPDISEPACLLIQSERQKLGGNLMKLQQREFDPDIAVCRHMDSMILLSTAAQMAIQQERLEIHVDLYYLKGLRQKPVPRAFQPRAIGERHSEHNALSSPVKLDQNNGIGNCDRGNNHYLADFDWLLAAQQPYEWPPTYQNPQQTQPPEIGNKVQEQQQPSPNPPIQMASQQFRNNFIPEFNNASPASFTFNNNNNNNVGMIGNFSSWNPMMRSSSTAAAADQSLLGNYMSGNNYWKSQQPFPGVHVHQPANQGDFVPIFEEKINVENYLIENQSTNLEHLC